MDARLDPAKYAGLSEGDAHVIRNAGGRASDDAIRSLVISHKLLGTAEWFVIHHTNCGMEFFTNEVMGDLLESSLETAALGDEGFYDVGEGPGSPEGKNIDWLTISDQSQAVVDDVEKIRNHPLVEGTIPIYGYVYHVETGRLVEVPAATEAGARRRRATPPSEQLAPRRRAQPAIGRLMPGRRRSLQDRQLDRRHRDDPAGRVANRLRGRVVGIGEDERRAVVGLRAQRHRERDLAQQRHVELVGERLTAALAEDLEALAGRGREAGHVLDDAGDLERDLARHLRGAARDLLRGRLRRRDDDELRLRQQLGERHRDVAGAGRQVDEQVVQLAPGDVLEELRQRLVQHRPAPDDRRVLLDEEADRHDLHAVGLEREDLALGRDRRALAAETEHARDRVAPDVGVEDADGLAVERQRGGEVRGQRRLADAALARADAQDVLDLGQRAGGHRAAAERLLQRRLLRVGEDVEGDGHRADAGDRAGLAGDGLGEAGCGSGSRRSSARR